MTWGGGYPTRVFNDPKGGAVPDVKEGDEGIDRADVKDNEGVVYA